MSLGVESLRVFILVVVGMWLCCFVDELFYLRSYSASLSLSALTCAGASVRTHGRFPEVLEYVLAFLILFGLCPHPDGGETFSAKVSSCTRSGGCV